MMKGKYPKKETCIGNSVPSVPELTNGPSAKPWFRLVSIPKFHLQMAIAFGAYLIFSIVGSTLTSIRAPEEGQIAIAVIFLIAALQFLPVYWHTKASSLYAMQH